MQMKQITKVFFLNFTFCYQFQFQGDLYVSITRVIIHLLIHEPQNWKKTPIMTYSCIITSLHAIPFETGLIYFLPLCWASTLIKGKILGVGHTKHWDLNINTFSIIEHLLCASHFINWFTYIISFESHSNSRKLNYLILWGRYF